MKYIYNGKLQFVSKKLFQMNTSIDSIPLFDVSNIFIKTFCPLRWTYASFNMSKC